MAVMGNGHGHGVGTVVERSRERAGDLFGAMPFRRRRSRWDSVGVRVAAVAGVVAALGLGAAALYRALARQTSEIEPLGTDGAGS